MSIRSTLIVVATLAVATFASQRIFAADAPAKTAAHTPPWVELITIDGSINPATASYIGDSLASANAEGASALARSKFSSARALSHICA